jgi:RNA polymerase sigma-70 factor (ECF subfamily)
MKTMGISSDVAACVPAMRAISFVLTGNRQRADELVEEAINWFITDPSVVSLGIRLKVRMFSVLHELRCIGRDKSRETVRSIGDSGANTTAAQSIQDDSLVSDDFRSAFWQLGEDEREALILVEVSNLSYEEVAKVCGSTTSIIDIRVSRARQNLARMLSTVSEGRDLVSPSQMQPQH